MLVSVGMFGLDWSAFCFHGNMGPHCDAYVSLKDREGEYNMVLLSVILNYFLIQYRNC